jgi:hypothetical protein
MFIECPNCEAVVDGELLADITVNQEMLPTKHEFIKCKICGNPLVLTTTSRLVFGSGIKWNEPYRAWPFPDPNQSSYIFYPELVTVSLKEADLCFRAKAYTACAVMCGRALEGVCKNHDPKIKSLDSGLKKLLADGVIDKKIYEWGEELRKNRNLGAHASTNSFAPEDAADLIDFTHTICEYVFVMNMRFEDFKERQLKRQSDPNYVFTLEEKIKKVRDEIVADIDKTKNPTS